LANSQHSLLNPISGSYYRSPSTPSVSTGTGAAAVNTTYYTPIDFSQSVTLDRIAINTTFTGFSGTASVRLGIFANTNGKPGTLILDAGTVSPITNNASYAITINQSLSTGIYWLAMNSITAASVNAYYGVANVNTLNNDLFGGAIQTTTSSSGASGYTQSYNATSGFADAGTVSLTAFNVFTYVRVA